MVCVVHYKFGREIATRWCQDFLEINDWPDEGSEGDGEGNGRSLTDDDVGGGWGSAKKVNQR